MTAFACKSQNTALAALTWELRSVNHRYLDINLRLPEDFRALEPMIRETIQQTLKRGKVDGQLKLQTIQEKDQPLEIDTRQVRKVLKAAAALAGKKEKMESLRAIDLLRWPGVITAETLDLKTLHAPALKLLRQTLDELMQMRLQEGAQLKQFILQRLTALHDLTSQAKKRLPKIITHYRQKIRDRLAEAQAQLDPQRVEQEIILYANRIDVHEELDRLGAHVEEAKRILDAQEPVGRRLDFLTQELNREANTLGAKSTDLALTNIAVEAKVLIEQMREQIQNIE